MTPTDFPLKEPTDIPVAIGGTEAGDVTPSEFDRVERALVDASTRTPVLMFYFTAIGWLLFGTLFGFLTSIRMHTPDWLSDVSFLTWGRIRPVHMNVMVYGWASHGRDGHPAFG
jgi:cytochrome c oxidase cbb3-type subunit 1